MRAKELAFWDLVVAIVICTTGCLAVHLTDTDRQIALGVSGQAGSGVDLQQNSIGVHDGFQGGTHSGHSDQHSGTESHVDLPNRSRGHGHGHGPRAHVDLPGQHGNRSPFPVIHRKGGSTHDQNIPQHGENRSPGPVIHGERGHGHGQRAHVDLPGQHGNRSPFPVIHRKGGSTHGSNRPQHGENRSPGPVVHGERGHGHGPRAHVDLPGQHGNRSPFPVIHRKGGPIQGHNRPQQNESVPHANLILRESGHDHGTVAHVDLPGQHGNRSPVPVVHRERGHGHGHGHGSGAHVDLPGQHGNRSPVPVIHRERGHDHGHGSGAHVDLPGQHDNRSPFPVVHRENGHDHGLNHTSHDHVDIPRRPLDPFGPELPFERRFIPPPFPGMRRFPGPDMMGIPGDIDPFTGIPFRRPPGFPGGLPGGFIPIRRIPFRRPLFRPMLPPPEGLMFRRSRRLPILRGRGRGLMRIIGGLLGLL